MNKNQIFIKSGTEYKKMTKELLTASNLAELIGDRHKMVGIKPKLVSPSDPSDGDTTHFDFFVFISVLCLSNFAIILPSYSIVLTHLS